jgi:hypothetical protein
VLADRGIAADAPGCTEHTAEPGAGDEEHSGGVVAHSAGNRSQHASLWVSWAEVRGPPHLDKTSPGASSNSTM